MSTVKGDMKRENWVYFEKTGWSREINSYNLHNLYLLYVFPLIFLLLNFLVDLVDFLFGDINHSRITGSINTFFRQFFINCRIVHRNLHHCIIQKTNNNDYQ